MSGRITAPLLKQFKADNRPIVCCTAYDSRDAEWLELAGVDVVLVGDSVANNRLGRANTVHVDLDDLIHHTLAVASHCHAPLVVSDLPFGSYQVGTAEAVDSAVQLMRAGAEAVKLEGAYFEEIALIAKAGIPVMGHVGMTPQSVNALGGHKVQGRSESEADYILEVAQRIEASGAFALVLELIPTALSERITKSLSIPTIGIGAGLHCDGQIQVIDDLLGYGERAYKHAKAYLDGRSLSVAALKAYVEEVRIRKFPTEENSF